MSNYNDLDNRRIYAASGIAVALTFIIILACQVVYYAFASRHEAYRMQRANFVEGNRFLGQEMEALGSYGVNVETGQLQVPLEIAFEKMLSAASGDNADTDEVIDQDSV